MGNDKQKHLNQETRASQALLVEFGGILGTMQAVLMQAVQPSGIDEPRVPQIQGDELHMCNAGVSDQARVQNIKYFSERDKQKQRQPILTAAMDQLTSMLAGCQPQQQARPPTGPQQLGTALPPPADDSTGTKQMDMGAQETETSQGDVTMGDRNRVHGSGSMGLTEATKET